MNTHHQLKARRIVFVSALLALLTLTDGGGSLSSRVEAADAAQTAQSVMASLEFDATAYIIEQTITWKFDRGTHREPGTAMEYYTNTRTAGPVFVRCTGSGANCGLANAPTESTIAAAEPAPNEVKLQQHAQAQRCIFFSGGTLTNDTYTQEADVDGQNGKGKWTYRWTYAIEPVPDNNDVDSVTSGVQVAPGTAWTSDVTGGTVDVGFSGFIASESFQSLRTRNKYSFTMLEGDLTRVRQVSVQLQASDGSGGWFDVGSPVSLNNVDTDGDSQNDALDVEPAAADFQYFGNGGKFGNLAVFGALHASGSKAANWVSNILTGSSDGSAYQDNFAGNDGDLAAGNVHVAPFGATITGLSEPGSYRVVISGVIKGNSGSLDFSFQVSSNVVVIGGC